MHAEWTPRERMLCAIGNGKPDRVPVAPDISCMIPVRHSGKGYFAVFVEEDPPLWKAYLDAVAHFGIDGWFTYGSIGFVTKDVEISRKWIENTAERKVRETTFHTAKGDLTERMLYSTDKPPIRIERLVKDLERDFPRLRHLFGPILEADASLIATQKEANGEAGAFGVGLATPGFQIWIAYFEGGIETLSYLAVDQPALLDELRDIQHRRIMEELDHILAAGPDFVLTGGSGSITLASPEYWRNYSLPTLKATCERCSQKGVLSMVHSCGRQRPMIEVCAQETSLNCINPLEIPPMGDMTLAEAKQLVRGTSLSLMGNLHTTDVMLNPDVNVVHDAAKRAIADAGAGGGFILSTGDQCGWNTPEENIFELVRTAETYGVYD